MAISKRSRRCAAGLVLAFALLLPGAALAENEYPDFYATIIAIAADQSTITVSPTKDQVIVIDVRQLGRAPFDEGAFALNNVVLLHTRRVGGLLVAYGWQQARTGDEDTAFEGTERRRVTREKEDKDRVGK